MHHIHQDEARPSKQTISEAPHRTPLHGDLSRRRFLQAAGGVLVGGVLLQAGLSSVAGAYPTMAADNPNAFRLRVMSWNIQEGIAGLEAIATQIRQQKPAIVLLNEVRKFFPLCGADQTAELARMLGYPYCNFQPTVVTGWTGHKGVAILSNYQLLTTAYHPVMLGGQATAFGTLEATLFANGLTHHVFSTRFAPRGSADHITENELGIQQATYMAKAVNADHAVIFGGDFNANDHDPQIVGFKANSGLRDAFQEQLDPLACGDGDPSYRIDYVFIRGPYRVQQVQSRCPWPADKSASDHSWMVVDLVDNRPPPPPEDPACEQIRVDIASTEEAIQVLSQLGTIGANLRIKQLQAQLKQLYATAAQKLCRIG